MIYLLLLLSLGSLAVGQESAPPPSVEAPATLSAPPPAPVEWKPNLKWSGDLRYRLAKAKESIDEERQLQQLRARLGVRADVNESVAAVIRLATASSAISTNQTLGDSSEPGMARRSFGLDLAYLDWSFLQLGQVWAGRVANPFWAPNKTQVLFDSDLAFEGIALKFEPKWRNGAAFLNLGAFIVSENYSSGVDSVDIGIAGGDIGVALDLFEQIKWTTHFGNYYFFNVQNNYITRVEKDAKIDSYSYPHDRYRGNTVYVEDALLPSADRKYRFQTEFVLLEAGTEFKHKLGPVEYLVFADLIENTKVGQYGRAVEYGASLKWKFLTYTEAVIRKQSDSVVGAFTDSDANGGGTDNKGTRRTLALQLGKSVSLAASHFSATRGVDTVQRKYSGTHIDLMAGF